QRVVILDQTGEYRSKKAIAKYAIGDWAKPGVSVLEPKVGEIGPDFALGFLSKLVEEAAKEYEQGKLVKRTILIDEAHQFVPEPAGLGFGAPGRDSSYKIGTLIMQIRKYGLSVILVSQ